MATNATGLYGVPRPKNKPKHEITSSTSLAFTSQLSSLISQTRPTTTTSARARPSKLRKDDIFTSHNKGAKKRAAADLSTDPSFTQKHKTDIGAIDSATLHRSKRKMEEKARLYAAMKRGDYIPPNTARAGINDEREPLVDFDRKWAEAEAAGKAASDTSSGSDDGASDEEEQVEFDDEFGRRRLGTKTEAARELRRRRGMQHAELELSEMSARPAMPSGLIYGDTVQVAAFNPDEPIAAQMESLARKRDRSATPPPDTHYDATKEVRTRGVGFYQFSGDKEGRKREMDGLEREREETARRQKEREERREERKREIEERRRLVREKRGERLAEGFLEQLGSELGAKAEG